MTVREVCNGYTEGEIRLFDELGYGHLARLESGIFNDTHSMGLYRICVEHVFCNNISGPATEALRRAYSALRNCTVYRHTEEFEELIKF